MTIDELTAELKAANEKIAAPQADKRHYKSKFLESELTAAATRALIKHGDPKELLLPVILPQLKAAEADDGSVKVRVINDKGHPRIRDGKATTCASKTWLQRRNRIPAIRSSLPAAPTRRIRLPAMAQR
ncbi:MAG: hypothetical protein GY947_12445 [Rhodobacteraceae bacterium]|nr:hypothetical protein [Paracoccaceae bacterium]